MKKNKVLAVLLIVAMVLGMVPMSPVQAAGPRIDKKIQYYLYDNMGAVTVYAYLDNPITNGKITKIKNSNPSVAKVGVSPYNKSALAITLKSKGTTKVTFQYAKKKFTTRITVQQWKSPCKTFKIGNRDYAKYFEESGQYNLNNQKKDRSVKIKIVPKSGWKLQKIERFTADEPPKKIRNNSKIKLMAGSTGTGVYVYFKNTKTKETRRLYFGYSNAPIESGNIYNN